MGTDGRIGRWYLLCDVMDECDWWGWKTYKRLTD